jgi:glycosyltransferase involved in cell wall biosynthesis
MKVLIVAPRFCSPWTEGRKIFVRDLIEQAAVHWELCGLVTFDPGETSSLPADFIAHETRHAREHLLFPANALPAALTSMKPDLVCYFPFGAFNGLRGMANLWSIWKISRLCRQAGIPVMTLMYSLTMEANSWFHQLFLRDVYFNQHGDGARGIRFGVKFPDSDFRFDLKQSPRRLLFMAGASHFNAERLDYVLDVRGLRILLKAGKALQRSGYQLVTAIPFLEQAEACAALRNHPDNTWNTENLIFRNEVSKPDIYKDCCAFVFPYGLEEKQFVPTSVVEAMHYRVPVILPDLAFLSPFITDTPRALVYQAGDMDSLLASVGQLDTMPGEVERMCEEAARFVDSEYHIANTVKDIETSLAATARN